MLPHNIKVNEKNDNHSHRGQSCRVCETTEEHDCCVAEMTNLSKKGLNTIAVFDKSSNTLTRQSWGHLKPDDGINAAMEFRNIVMTHADKDTKHVMVHSEARANARPMKKCE